MAQKANYTAVDSSEQQEKSLIGRAYSGRRCWYESEKKILAALLCTKEDFLKTSNPLIWVHAGSARD